MSTDVRELLKHFGTRVGHTTLAAERDGSNVVLVLGVDDGQDEGLEIPMPPDAALTIAGALIASALSAKIGIHGL